MKLATFQQLALSFAVQHRRYHCYRPLYGPVVDPNIPTPVETLNGTTSRTPGTAAAASGFLAFG